MTVDLLRAQHARLERLFLQILAVTSVPEGHPVVDVLIEELVRLLGKYCLDEEDFMREMSYPQLPGHRLQHCVLLDDAKRIRAGVKDRTMSMEHAIKGLKAALNDHQQEADRDMFAYASRWF